MTEIMASDRYSAYMDMYNAQDKVIEEFVADTLAGMNDYTETFSDVVNDYWNEANESNGYNPSEYQDQIDDGTKFSMADDGIPDASEIMAQLVEKYGAIKKGENPVRDIDVPKKINDYRPVSQFARTMMEAGVTPDDTISEFEKLIVDGTMTHEVITNKVADKWAKDQINTLGFEGALNKWNTLSESSKIGKKELALGMTLYNTCITNKDIPNAMKLAADLVAEATRAGQTLQATRMLKLMTPDGQLYYIEKSIQKLNQEFKDKLGDGFKDIEIDEDLMERYFKEKDETKRDEIYDEICQNIADQIPPTFRDKWNTWRFLAMLGNPRTHIRNIVGNAIFMPANAIKNYVGAVMEFTIKPENRTKSFYTTKEAREFAKKDYESQKQVLQGVNAKYAITGDIESKRTMFTSKLGNPIEWLLH